MIRLAAAVTAVAAIAVTGSAGGATSTQKRTTSADPDGGLVFTKKKLRAHPGVVKIVMTNPKSSGLPHGVGIAGHGKGKVVNPGGTSSVKAKLKKGTYTFYCPAPGHRAAGMKGKLVIQ
jgi:plastocyanin